MSTNQYTWTDNPTVSGVAICDTDILNECLMHLKYDKKEGNGFPLFTPMVFDHILSGEESVGWALQGSAVTNTYPDAVSKIQELYTDGVETVYRNISCRRSVDGRYIAAIEQKSAIDELFVTTGIADFYIWDSINQLFYLPRSKWFNQFTTDTDLVNTYNEAGLPNITGTANSSANKGEFNVFSGAFKADTGARPNISGNSPAGYYGLSFDASASNDIYGNSETVQPKSSNKLLYYKVGNTISNESEIDVSNLTNDILLLQNSKLDIDLSNCTKPYVTETYSNGASWYRIYSDGWCEQGGINDCYSGAQTTISLLKNYQDSNYTVLSTYNAPNYVAVSPALGVNNKQTGSFNLYTVGGPYAWRTFGYISQGE